MGRIRRVLSTETLSLTFVRAEQDTISDPDRIRTCDLLLRRQLLYPAELRDQFVVVGAGIEPARTQCPLDFKSNVSTYSTTRPLFRYQNVKELF